MIPFEYLQADDFDASARLVDHRESMALAGGTTLVDLMKLNVLTPARVVNIKSHLNSEIREKNEELMIGAGCSMTRLADHKTVREQFPALRQSLLLAASPQIRNMATIGGNLLQRTRSTYFRHVNMPSDAVVAGDQDAEFGAGADSSNLAIMGHGGRLIGTYPGDFGIVLVAFNGTIHLKTAQGERTVPAREFYRLPDQSTEYSTVLQPNELITAVSVPLNAMTRNSIYLKVRERSSYAFALASAAVGLELVGQGAAAEIRTAVIGLGGLAPIPWYSSQAVTKLQKQKASDDSFRACANAALADAKPPSGAEFKVPLAKRSLVRALQILRDRGPMTDQQVWAMQHGRE